MNGHSIVVPFGLAVLLITGRSLAAPKGWRMPRPYEYSSAGVIYAGAGLLGMASPPLGTAVAWGYLVALLLAPNSANFLTTVAGGIKSPPGTAPQKGAAAA